jgi:hypothetical protein
MRKAEHFGNFVKSRSLFFAIIYQSPFDSHQVLTFYQCGLYNQCCRSGMFGSASKNLSIFNPKIVCKLFANIIRDVHPGSQIQGVKKASDPGSATRCITYFNNFSPLLSQGLLEEQPFWLQPGCGKHSTVPGKETKRPSGPIYC